MFRVKKTTEKKQQKNEKMSYDDVKCVKKYNVNQQLCMCDVSNYEVHSNRNGVITWRSRLVDRHPPVQCTFC